VCVFKEKEFKEAKKLNGLIAGGIVVIILAFALPFLSNPGNELVPKFTLAQLAVSSAAFIIILVALGLTMVQLRKSMAKPLIKVAFNKSGDQQATLIYKNGQVTNSIPSLCLINEGNAVARYFQIDFVIPEDIGKPSAINYQYAIYTSFVKDNNDYTLSYTNDGRYTLFVNRPYQDPNIVFSAAIDAQKCIEVYKDSFKIKYKVYGDWAETQEGELKVNINKL
jgi:hypothetical protein